MMDDSEKKETGVGLACGGCPSSLSWLEQTCPLRPAAALRLRLPSRRAGTEPPLEAQDWPIGRTTERKLKLQPR
jgi:hypothetical protein